MKSKEDGFTFSVQQVPEGEAVTAEEIEHRLLKQLKDRGEADKETLWDLSNFYNETQRQEEARAYLDMLLKLPCDQEERAGYYLNLGQVSERMSDFPAAASFYREALLMEPCHNKTWYFIHNNLGFSLNQMGLFEEAAKILKAAISIDPSLTNAYKNLGLACQGLEQYAEAAEWFITATKVNAADERSLKHLEDLCRAHPELIANNKKLSAELRACRQVVKIARSFQPDLKKQWRKARQQQKC